MICWHCHWGWSKPVANIYHEAVKKLGAWEPLHFSAGHIVWEDENWDCVEDCLRRFDEWKNTKYTKEQNEIVRWSLEELSKIPLEIRDPCPDDYDGKHPENFPPPDSITMVKI